MEKRILTLILLLAAGWLQAQEAWPLERCIQYALEHNTGIREQRVQIDLRKAELRQMQTGHLPVLRAGVAQEFNWGRSVDMQELVIIKNKLTQATGATLTATATLFEGFAQHYGRLAAKKAVEAARQDARSQDEALTIDVTRAYLQLMLARQILSYTEESLSAIILQRERTALMVEAGSQPKTALSEIEAQVAAEKAAMVEASCRVRTATLALTQLMNLPPGAAFAAGDAFEQEEVLSRVPLISETQMDDYIRQAPELLSAQASLERLRHQQTRVQAAFLPSLRLSASYGTYYSRAAGQPFRTQIDENRNPSLSLQLDIPIFQAFQAASQLRKSRLACDLARLGVEKVRTQLADRIRSAAIEADNCCQQYLSSEETLRAMESLLAVMEAKYNLGAASAVDYILARNHHFKAVSDYLQAKWQYLFQLKLLERYRL